jgi:hypothetical protein
VGVIARFLAVQSQAVKQAPEERLVSCQACCPVGFGFVRETIAPLLTPCIVEWSAAEGHDLLLASGGLIIPRASKAVEESTSAISNTQPGCTKRF